MGYYYICQGTYTGGCSFMSFSIFTLSTNYQGGYSCMWTGDASFLAVETTTGYLT